MVFRAWQRARASKGNTHWVEELYGMRPLRITGVIAKLTYELMIEEDRLQRAARVKAEGGSLIEDGDLRLAEPEMVHWLRSKRLRIRY